MRSRKLFDPGDSERIRNFLAAKVDEARARGDEVITFNVGRICTEIGLESRGGYLACSNVLDSDRFARNHNLEYHHRMGIWGSEDAEYTFIFDRDSRSPPTSSSSHSPKRMLRVALWLIVALTVAAFIWLLLDFSSGWASCPGEFCWLPGL